MPATIEDIRSRLGLAAPPPPTLESLKARLPDPGPSLAASTARAVPRGAIEMGATALKPYELMGKTIAEEPAISALPGGAERYMTPAQREELRARAPSAPISEEIGRFAAEALPIPPVHEQRLPVQVGRGVGTGLGFMATRMLPGGAAALPVLALSAGAGEAIERGAAEGATDPEKAQAALMGAVAGLTDILPIENLLRPVKHIPGVKGMLYGMARKAVEQGVIEGTQEGIQQWMQNAIAKLVHTPEQELAEGVATGAGIGFLVGTIFGAPAGGISSQVSRAQPPEVLPPSERVEPRLDVDQAAPAPEVRPEPTLAPEAPVPVAEVAPAPEPAPVEAPVAAEPAPTAASLAARIEAEPVAPPAAPSPIVRMEEFEAPAPATSPTAELTASDLVDIPARKFPKSAFKGELKTDSGDHIGFLYLHEGRAYVGQPRAYGRGELIKMLPGSFDPKAFTRAGGMQVSAGQRVKFWKLKDDEPQAAKIAPEPEPVAAPPPVAEIAPEPAPTPQSLQARIEAPGPAEARTEAEAEAEAAPIASPDDINLTRARQAYEGMSFSPEKRAEQEQAAYVEDVESLHEALQEHATTERQRAIVAEQIERYKRGYLQKNNAVLAAKSRTISPMITGPSNFPTRRNQKRLNTEMRRIDEFMEWRKKARGAAFKAVHNARSGEQVAADEWTSLKSRLDRSIATVKEIDAGDAPGFDRSLFTSSMAGKLRRRAASGETDLVRQALAYIREAQAGMKKPIFAPRNRVWNLVDVAEEKAAIEAPTGETVVAEYAGARIVNNFDEERVQIDLDERPSSELRKDLKAEAWRWSPTNGVWQRKNTNAAVKSAQRIVGSTFKTQEAAPTYEPTAIGEQAVIPGAEQITEAELAQRRTDAPLQARVAQAVPSEGIFDVAGRGQLDLVEQARQGAPTGKGPVDLLEFLRNRGGLQDQGGELAGMDAQREHLGKPFQKRLVRDDGMTLDTAREAAVEAGYLPADSTVADFLDAVSENIQGRRVWSQDDLDEVLEREAFQAAEDDAAEQVDREYVSDMQDDFLHAGIAWPYSKQLWETISKPFERLSPLGKLPEKKRYLLSRYLTLGRLDAIEREAQKVGQVFRKASAADKSATYEFLTSREASPDIIGAPAVRTAAITAKKAIEKLGRRLVDAGLIPKESFDANRGQYLPRVYLKYLLPEGAFAEGGGARPKPSTLGYTKARKDIPKDIRDLVLGEVKDPAYLAAKAMAIPARDLEILDFLGKISADPDWTFPETMVDWRDRQVTAYWLKSEATRVRNDIVPRLQAEQRDAALAIADQMDAIAKPPIDELGGKVPADYKQIPDTQRYGMLRGMWVRKEIHDDIMGAANMARSADASTAEKILGYGGVATKATQLWKLSKVAMNPPTQARNFVSNAVLLHLSGVPFHRVYGPKNIIAEAIGDIRRGGQYWTIAQKYGVAKSTFAATEIHGLQRDVMRLQAEKQGPMGHVKRMALAVADTAGDIYGMSEAVFKTAKIMDAMKREGLSEGDAALAAQETMFDYSLVPRSVGYLRNAPIGVPFLTFYYKAFPRMVEAAVKRPAKFAPYIVVPMIMHAMIAAEYDVEPEDVDKLRKALPKWLQDRGNAWVLPWKDKADRWQAVDVGYFLPWSMYLEVGKAAGKGEAGEALRAAGGTSSPLIQITSAVTTNIDPFTEREIANPADPPAKQVADIMKFTWRMAMPTWLTDIGAANRLNQAIQGKTDYYGDPGYTVWQAIPRFVGINVYPVEPAVSRRRNIVRMSREIDDISSRMRGVLRDKRLNADQKKRERDSYRAHIKRKQDEMKAYMKASQIPPQLQ